MEIKIKFVPLNYGTLKQLFFVVVVLIVMDILLYKH